LDRLRQRLVLLPVSDEKVFHLLPKPFLIDFPFQFGSRVKEAASGMERINRPLELPLLGIIPPEFTELSLKLTAAHLAALKRRSHNFIIRLRPYRRLRVNLVATLHPQCRELGAKIAGREIFVEEAFNKRNIAFSVIIVYHLRYLSDQRQPTNWWRDQNSASQEPFHGMYRKSAEAQWQHGLGLPA